MFYTIQDNQILKSSNKQLLEKYYSNVKELPPDYEFGKYIIENNRLVLNSNYEEEKAQEERERLSLLNLTAADVERAIYKAKGMDFDDIIEMVTQLQPEGLDIKALKIELKANNFYRGNPYIEQIGALLDFTSEMLDEFFETKDYKKLIKFEKDNNTGEAFDINSNLPVDESEE